MHTSHDLLAAYMASQGKNPRGAGAVLDVIADELHDEREGVDQSADMDEFLDEENDIGAEEQMDQGDAECFELLSQLRAREEADKVEWADIQNDTAVLAPFETDINGDAEAQRLGCGHKLPPQTLDTQSWHKVCGVDGSGSGGKEEPQSSGGKRSVTLTSVFEQARVGDGDLRKVDALTPFLWQSLVQLRAPADHHILPRPQRFKVAKELNWHQACEHEASIIRSLVGVPSKRTSRAAAWRAVSASLKKATGEDRETGDIASGLPILYAPVGRQEWVLGVTLTVWRGTAKGGCKPSALPVPIDVARCLRVCQLVEKPNAPEGTYMATSESPASVIPAHRLGLVLRSTRETGIDGLKIVFGAKEIEIINAAKTFVFSANPDEQNKLQQGRKRKAPKEPEVMNLVSDEEGEKEAHSTSAKPSGSSGDVSKASKRLDHSGESGDIFPVHVPLLWTLLGGTS